MSQPSSAARLRWHQQRRQAFAPHPAAATANPHTAQAASTAPAPAAPPPSSAVGQHGSNSAASGGGSDALAFAWHVCVRQLGLAGWQSVGVHHCRDAWGLVLEHADGWKLVYSGGYTTRHANAPMRTAFSLLDPWPPPAMSRKYPTTRRRHNPGPHAEVSDLACIGRFRTLV